MPFYDGQGLHDAPWRSEFGGTIYQTNGSHGCINLPADAAKVIYDNMEERMAIFLYK
jgi:lipoprotein-anchoring transpeptidase ErfK/SrfK